MKNNQGMFGYALCMLIVVVWVTISSLADDAFFQELLRGGRTQKISYVSPSSLEAHDVEQSEQVVQYEVGNKDVAPLVKQEAHLVNESLFNSRYGELRIDGQRGDMELFYKNKRVPTDILADGLSFEKGFSFGEDDVVLLGMYAGTACPASYRLIVVSQKVGISVLPDLGVCSYEILGMEANNGIIKIVLPDFAGPYNSDEDKETAANQRVVFTITRDQQGQYNVEKKIELLSNTGTNKGASKRVFSSKVGGVHNGTSVKIPSLTPKGKEAVSDAVHLFDRIYKETGALGGISFMAKCYESIKPTSSPESMIFCLAFDIAASGVIRDMETLHGYQKTLEYQKPTQQRRVAQYLETYGIDDASVQDQVVHLVVNEVDFVFNEVLQENHN